jgi:threonine aldolase
VEKIAGIKEIEVKPEEVETNMVMIKMKSMSTDTFLEKLAEHKVLALPINSRIVRIVTHKDIDDNDVERAAAAIGQIFQS